MLHENLLLETARRRGVGLQHNVRLQPALGKENGGLRTCIPTFVQIIDSCLCFRLPLVSRIDISNQMIAHIVADLKVKTISHLSPGKVFIAHMQFKQMPELRKFNVEIFVNRIKTLLQLSFRQFAYRVVGWIVVHVW